MGLMNHAVYQVATKALLFDGGKILTLVTPDGYMDFPGGRVDESEVDLSWQEALQREMIEELGDRVTCTIGNYAFVSKRVWHHDGKRTNVAAIYFMANYTGGEITLSDEHRAYEWLTPAEILSGKRTCMSPHEQSELTNFLQKNFT